MLFSMSGADVEGDVFTHKTVAEPPGNDDLNNIGIGPHLPQGLWG